MSTHRCDYCGGDIIFRYVDGRCIPIHLTGGCGGWGEYTSDYVYERPNTVYSYNYNPDDFCRPTKCPHCGEDVFFIRHNGGSVWVDELGWPWPKHACFDNNDSYERIYRTGKAVKSPLLAIVIRAEKRPDKMADRVVVFCEDNRMAFIYVPDLKEPQKLAGSLAILSQQEKIIFPEIAVCKIDYIDFGKNAVEVKVIDNIAKSQGEVKKELKKCPECKIEIENRFLYFHRIEVHQIGFCPICYELMVPEKLDRHLRKEHLITIYHMIFCPICNIRIRVDLLTPHLRVAHNREHCPFCQGFAKTDIFEKHLYYNHGAVNPRETKKDNISEINTQDQRKKYKCEYCNYSANKRGHLYIHMQHRHPKELKAQKRNKRRDSTDSSTGTI